MAYTSGTMKILGSSWPAVRGQILERRFTRPMFRAAYLNAVEDLREDADAIETLYQSGVEQTNHNDYVTRCQGAMKLIAVGDACLTDMQEDRNLSLPDLQRLFRAIRAYHFAANTFRQIQQFELSTDLYVISARVGEAFARSLHVLPSAPESADICHKILDWTDRSFMRANAVCRETGADRRIKDIFVEHRDFRKDQAGLIGQGGTQFVLGFWRLVSI